MSDEIKKENEEETIVIEKNENEIAEKESIEEKKNEIAETESVEEKEEIKEEEKEEKVENIEKETEEVKEGKKTKLKHVIILLAIICAVIAIVVVGIFVFNNKCNKVGNSIGNIRNYGYAASQGRYIYYVAPGENAEKIAIYKAKKDGSEIETLILKDWEIYGLNVVGKYIYFVAIENNEVLEEDSINNKIYRMKLDGTELQVINDNNFYNESYEIYVIKDKIYYMGKDLNVYSMNLDGTEQTVINDDQTGFIGINEKYIIFNKEKEKEEGETKIVTYYMNLDGTDKKEITGERLYSINVVGDDLYYVDTNKNVYKVNLKTGENVLVAETQAYNMNVSNKYIYFMDYTDESEYVIGIYKMKLDGTEKTKLLDLDSYSTFLDIVSERVVYMDSNDEKGVVNIINPKNLEISNLFTYKFIQENVETLVQDTTAANTTN